MHPLTAPITAWWPATWPATPPTTSPFRHPAACAVPTAVSNVSADIAVTTFRVFICSSKKMVGLGCRPVAGVYVGWPQHYGGRPMPAAIQGRKSDDIHPFVCLG